jgi:hypothetical protein
MLSLLFFTFGCGYETFFNPEAAAAAVTRRCWKSVSGSLVIWVQTVVAQIQRQLLLAMSRDVIKQRKYGNEMRARDKFFIHFEV